MPEIRYFGSKASSLSSPAGKYVNFNCNQNNCEVWQIVKVEDGRLVLTRTADYTGAGERAWTGKYYSGLVFNDDGTMVRYIDFTAEDYDTWGGYTLKEYAEAIETLLTAYEEEKEENKRLRKCHLQYEEMTGIDLLLPSKEE